MGFDKSAERKPTIACIGTLSSLDAATLSKSGFYYMQKYSLQGKVKGTDGKSQLLWVPDFFKPGFNKERFAASLGDKGRGVKFVYEANIASAEKTSTLEAMCGGSDGLDELASYIHSLTDFDPDAVGSTIQSYVRSLGPIEIGYIMRQQRKKTEDGSVVREPYMEIDSFFLVTEKQIKKLVNRAVSNREKIAKIDSKNIDLIAKGEEPEELPDLFQIKFDTSDYGVVDTTKVDEEEWAVAPA